MGDICGACGTGVGSSCAGLRDVEKICSADGCKVLAGGMTGRTCDDYCSSNGLSCKDAWEEQNEDCNVKASMTCSQVWQGTSDLICECEPARRLSGGHMAMLV